jgi:CubicO group peptidase (beta-lactamase class C family)
MIITRPEEMGFSSQRLSRINSVMQSYIDQKKLAGVVTLVARRGKVVHFEKLGMASMEDSKPMQLDTIFRIYSMTKPVTSAAVMMLFEDGHFHLSDPISRFIPSFKHIKVLVKKTDGGMELADLKREITVRDLLTHTSGLSYGDDENVYLDALYRQHGLKSIEVSRDITLENMINELSRLPLAHQPGTAYRYSFSIDVLGYLIQVVSGKPFDMFLKQAIFEPLGMVDTDFYIPQEKLSRFSTTYGPAEGGGLKVVDPMNTSIFTKPTLCPTGGAGLVSTAADYLRFGQMLLNKGELDGVRLLGRKTVEMMTLNHLPEGIYQSDDKAYGFGLGGYVLLDPARSQNMGSVGNWGWSGAANTRFWIDFKEDLLGLLMLQLMPYDVYPVQLDFNNMVYQALT